MHPIILTQSADIELTAAQDWYEREVSGLGGRFRSAVEVAIGRISDNPRQFPVLYKTVRRALLRRFPYALLLVIAPDEAIMIIACFHGSRDPAHWQRRA